VIGKLVSTMGKGALREGIKGKKGDLRREAKRAKKFGITNRHKEPSNLAIS